MAVLRPLKVVIENYPEGQSEELEAVNHPEDPSAGTRRIRFGRELFIERDDFMENPPKKFFRLSPGAEVRLRYAYFITCREVVKNAAGEVVELRCTYDPGDPRRQRARWPQGAGDACIGSRRRTRCRPRCGSTIRYSASPIRMPAISPPISIRNRSKCWPMRASNRHLAGDDSDDAVQFERQGYFCRDRDSKPGRPVFNRTVGLRDTWAKVSGGG